MSGMASPPKLDKLSPSLPLPLPLPLPLSLSLSLSCSMTMRFYKFIFDHICIYVSLCSHWMFKVQSGNRRDRIPEMTYGLQGAYIRCATSGCDFLDLGSSLEQSQQGMCLLSPKLGKLMAVEWLWVCKAPESQEGGAVQGTFQGS